MGLSGNRGSVMTIGMRVARTAAANGSEPTTVLVISASIRAPSAWSFKLGKSR